MCYSFVWFSQAKTFRAVSIYVLLFRLVQSGQNIRAVSIYVLLFRLVQSFPNITSSFYICPTLSFGSVRPKHSGQILYLCYSLFLLLFSQQMVSPSCTDLVSCEDVYWRSFQWHSIRFHNFGMASNFDLKLYKGVEHLLNFILLKVLTISCSLKPADSTCDRPFAFTLVISLIYGCKWGGMWQSVIDQITISG